MCGGGPDRAGEMAELGRSPREQPSPIPEATRRAVGATGEAIAEEMAGEVGGAPALTVEVVDAEGPPFVAVKTMAVGFKEAAVAAGSLKASCGAQSQARGDENSRVGHVFPAG